MAALLCLHGLLSDSSDFTYLYSFLRQNYEYIYIPTMPGHGKRTDKFQAKEVLSYALESYDLMHRQYKKIDILGYSLGGVLAVYIAQYRNVHRLMLLAPAFYYLNVSNLKPKIRHKSVPAQKTPIRYRTIEYFFVFAKIVKTVKEQTQIIPCPICILWGEDDYLVSSRAGDYVYTISTNPIKFYVKLKNHNHYNIITSQRVADILKDFINK